MPHAIRRLIPAAFAVLLLAATAPGTAAVTIAFPTQSLGNRGVDVQAVQGLLLAHDIPSAIDGSFSAATVEAVKTFQAANGLTANGIVGTTTWEKLIIGLTLGSSGEAVKVVQRELNAKRHAGRCHRVPEAHGDDPARERRRGDLAEVAVALRLPGVQ